MENKKKFRIIGIAGLAAILLIGATLAYFTDHDQAMRFMELGHVDIELTEDMVNPADPDGDRIEYQNPENVIPGDVISKRPVITVASGSADCYLRTLLTITTPEALDPQVSVEQLNIDENKWFVTKAEAQNQWYCYYIGGDREGILSPNDSVFVFDEVEIPGEWQEKAYGAEIHVDVKAEAIQSENFTPLVEKDSQGKITSCKWQDTKGQQIVTEEYKGTV